MHPEDNTYCYYSDLPSPMAYMQAEEENVQVNKETLPEVLPSTKVLKNDENKEPLVKNTHE